ncbi:MAG: hypothetical protein AB7F86_06730 [Bdellovibrionales bacterium]
MPTKITAIFFLLLSGCASMEDIDRSQVNHAAMDLRGTNDCGEPSPSSGLRSVRKAGGTETCATCVH